jgi:cell division protein FtsZ
MRSLIDIKDLSLAEIYEAVDLVRDVVDSECNIIFGATIDENIKDEVQVTVIATGFDMEKPAKQPVAVQPTIMQDLAQPIQPTQPVVQPAEELEDEEVEEELKEEIPQPAQKVEDISFTSKIDLGDTSIPPFLRKMKK